MIIEKNTRQKSVKTCDSISIVIENEKKNTTDNKTTKVKVYWYGTEFGTKKLTKEKDTVSRRYDYNFLNAKKIPDKKITGEKLY